MALGRHLVAAHIRSVGWAVLVVFPSSPLAVSVRPPRPSPSKLTTSTS